MVNDIPDPVDLFATQQQVSISNRSSSSLAVTACRSIASGIRLGGNVLLRNIATPPVAIMFRVISQ